MKVTIKGWTLPGGMKGISLFGIGISLPFSIFKKKKVTKYKYGWRRDLPDVRDYQYKVTRGVDLPQEVDLRREEFHVVDQSTLGSCVGCGVANIHHAMQVIQNKPVHFYPSRLFIYYNARVLLGTVNYDSGATIRDGIKTIVKQGACKEEIWPYVISKYRCKPPSQCYENGLLNQAIVYESVAQDLYSLKYTLSQGFPIVGGISIYSSFESDDVARTGMVPMPTLSNESLLGGHCVSFFGFSDKKQCFIGMNSWGEKWGDRGWFYIPYKYITNKKLAADFWVVKLVE